MPNQSRRISTISKALRQACQQDTLYALLAEWDCGPLDGGCLVLADALRQLVGGKLIGLWGISTRGTLPTYQHVLLKMGRLYLDADGVSTQQQLVRRWREIEGIEVLDLVENPPIDSLCLAGIPYDADLAQAIQTYLANCLGKE